VRAAIAIAPFALLATSCGGKSDPYAKSLGMGSEHVEAKGVARVAGVRGVAFTESGDFTSRPDRGALTLHFVNGETFREVVTPDAVYIRFQNRWVKAPSYRAPVALKTPAQLFKAHFPATIKDGLVSHMQVRTPKLTMSIDFSRYGEHVSVTVPRVKGSK
jgi:hypothetical protein